MQKKNQQLNKNWKYRKASDKTDAVWKPAIVPGNIHLDLLANHEIDDPYYRTNEENQQWIGESDWEYYTEFEADDELLNFENINIIFEGLDTYADVYLNDHLILQADNMYCGWRVNIKSYIKTGKNFLRIFFHSVIKKTLPLYEKNNFIYGANNSQPEPKLSIFSRKPGYHFGWDWGPRLLTCGIWRPVYIEAWNHIRLENVRFIQNYLSDKSAELSLEINLISSVNTEVEFILSNPEDHFEPIEKFFIALPGINNFILDFKIKDPARWWCNGLGNQFLYTLNLEIKIDKKVIDFWSQKVGLRTLELVHEDDEYGKSFYFKLNDVPLFIKGSNFIPVDYFIPRVEEKDYRRLLQDAVDSNMNMLRLWGGAIYEEDLFYNLCDELGILIWQDFMFACAMYPADEIMCRRVDDEAKYNIIRLRNHPSLALWCGNNEINEGWHTWGWQERYNYSEEISKKIWDFYCKIFHEILPDAINKYDPSRAYLPSSPKFGFKDERSKTDGDMHYWGVWFNNHSKEKFDEYLPRFMSEYGLQSMPEIKTFKSFSLPEDWNINSEVMKAHQRQYPNLKKGQIHGGFDLMLNYLNSEYKLSRNFEYLIYLSQLLQADYLKYAIEVHRINKPYCMGTMYWQLNDVWPVISWSTIDYYGRWKAAQYFVKKAYSPLLVAADLKENLIDIYVISDLPNDRRVSLEFSFMNFKGEIFYNKKEDILISKESSNKFFTIKYDSFPENFNERKSLLNLKLSDNEGELSDNQIYFCKTNELELEEPEIIYSIEGNEKEYLIKISSKKLVKNLQINIENTEGNLSDNYFDLIPGKEKIIRYKTSEKWNKKLNLFHYYLLNETEIIKEEANK